MAQQQVIFKENDIKSLQTPMETELDKCIKHFEGELLKIRTGRAHTSMVEDIQVISYGQDPMPIRSMSVVSAPEARLITIQPWDTAVIPDIEKALKNSDLGVNPINDGKLIRIQLPQMSSARRDELNKVLGKKSEECKVAIRNVRKDYHNHIRDAKKDKKISENFFNRLNDTLQKITDKYVEKVEQQTKKKETEISSV